MHFWESCFLKKTSEPKYLYVSYKYYVLHFIVCLLFIYKNLVNMKIGKENIIYI